MAFMYHHLDDAEVRANMVRLWHEEHATFGGKRAYRPYLTDTGFEHWDSVMPVALEHHDDRWLMDAMSDVATLWMPTFQRRKPKGGFTSVEYNKRDAIDKLCVGEFNTAYVRGLATTLRDRGVEQCEVYRAAGAAEPRPDYCSALEGQQVAVADLLRDHRRRYYPAPGDRSARSIPSGPNCHHSIRAIAPR